MHPRAFAAIAPFDAGLFSDDFVRHHGENGQRCEVESGENELKFKLNLAGKPDMILLRYSYNQETFNLLWDRPNNSEIMGTRLSPVELAELLSPYAGHPLVDVVTQCLKPYVGRKPAA